MLPRSRGKPKPRRCGTYRTDELAELEQELLDEVAEIDARWREKAAEIQTISIRPESTDVRVTDLALVWVPMGELVTDRASV